MTIDDSLGDVDADDDEFSDADTAVPSFAPINCARYRFGIVSGRASPRDDQRQTTPLTCIGDGTTGERASGVDKPEPDADADASCANVVVADSDALAAAAATVARQSSFGDEPLAILLFVAAAAAVAVVVLFECDGCC
jgi:hypothetical protein